MPLFRFCRLCVWGLVFLSFCQCGLAAAGEVAGTVVVDASRTVRPTSRELLGINVNYLLDDDANRRPGAKPLARIASDHLPLIIDFDVVTA